MRARRCRDDGTRLERGFTLVEVLIATWVMGALMVGLIGALMTMTRASDVSRRITLAETELRGYVEWLRTQPYVQCAGQPNYPTYPTYTPSDTTGAVTSTLTMNSFWYPSANPSSFASINVHNFWLDPDWCVSGNPNDGGAQRIQLQINVSDAGGSYSVSTTIVKRSNDVVNP
jgi:prepilin-type N-terminal cleavage/methylation domain-containing protein